MSAVAPELAKHAQEVVARLVAAIDVGGSSAYLQLICSQLFETLRRERDLAETEAASREMLCAALDLCGRAGDPRIKASLRVAHLRAVVALLQAGFATQRRAMPRFRVIQGGLA